MRICLASSNVPRGPKFNLACDSWAPGALLWELFEPKLDIEADSEASPLPFYKLKQLLLKLFPITETQTI